MTSFALSNFMRDTTFTSLTVIIKILSTDLRSNFTITYCKFTEARLPLDEFVRATDKVGRDSKFLILFRQIIYIARLGFLSRVRHKFFCREKRA